jgi:hypothetical protein
MNTDRFERVVELLFPDKLSRFQFIVRTLLLCNAFVLLCIYVFSTLYETPELIFLSLIASALFLKLYFGAAIFAPRLRDIGESGWFALLLLVPSFVLFSLVVGIVLPPGWSTRTRAEWARRRALSPPPLPRRGAARPRVVDEY